MGKYGIVVFCVFFMGMQGLVGQYLLAGSDFIDQGQPSYFPLAKKDFKRLSSSYGNRIHPLHHIPKKHHGIDLVANSGSSVYAAAKGLVIKASYEKGYGNHIVIQHINGTKTLYGHLELMLIDEGAITERGQTIGTVGETGQVTGPHLHFEIWRLNTKVNPLLFWEQLIQQRKSVITHNSVLSR
ncbi:M23 family metallopeptidase [Aggregatimonas sangjinii]|uniref:M23 family metallopeptidase n=1 Tax=Aggregatimonas sangjinii TaxID=2583587 RepID=A0A5B7SV14_9FLAO|nr:M23 family metallopeptidase [Aggregatimonas sangjinii]QCX00670.1 M23 family metallopeptidase [Aggregatimonas sangjinii]